jgi:uncharacterized membrane protein
MSDLIVVGFKGEDTADQVLNKLAALRREHLIDLEDACVVVRDQNCGSLAAPVAPSRTL